MTVLASIDSFYCHQPQRQRDVASLINLPDDHLVTMLIAIGKPTQAPWPRAGQLPLNQVVINNSF